LHILLAVIQEGFQVFLSNSSSSLVVVQVVLGQTQVVVEAVVVIWKVA
jgi:hypothetical protein